MLFTNEGDLFYHFEVNLTKMAPKLAVRRRDDVMIARSNRSGPRGLAPKYCLVGVGQGQEAMHGHRGNCPHA